MSGENGSTTSAWLAWKIARAGEVAGNLPPEGVWDVMALACELPAESGLPLSRFRCAEIRKEVLARGIVGRISETTILRWLHQDALRPWNHRSWIFPREPDFRSKAGRVLDLYHRIWDGVDLGPREFVL